uniref:receptor protein-tyrosine kinase n=1 Tax=Cyprinus carpio TaxID=7962 RepID=A0A8C1ZJE3_CYPCA
MDYRRTQFHFLFLYLFVNNVFIGIQSKEHVLLDMKAAGSELGWLTWPNEEGWEVVQTVVNGSLLYTYSVCNVASDTEQDNWLRTTFIQRRPDVSRLSVELRFVVRDCNSFGGSSPSCRETFGLYLGETDTDVGTNFRKSQFRKIATVAPDEVTANRGGGRADLRVNIETKSIGPLSRRGFYLAFQDLGGCVALLGLRVFYTTCPATMRSLAAFPEQVASGAEVEGTCVKDAVVVGEAAPRMYCTSEGEWVVPVGQCLCRAGYQAVGDACKACEPGYYKSTDSNQPCEVCPENTKRSGRGALQCPCMEGFFRAPTEPNSAPCSSLPSPPQNLVYKPLLTAGSLQLSWCLPADTGGRSDITYSVACERCEGGLCSLCGGRVRFEPVQTALKDPEVVVSELEPHVNYTFTVEAQSGVSQFSRRRATASITTVLHFTDGPRVLYLKVEDQTTSSLTLSWVVDQYVQNNNSPRYELMYRKKDPGELDVTTYTVLVLEKNSVQINDLLPGTKYVFRVHTLTAEGHPSSHNAELEFETLPLAESQTQNSSMVVMGAIAGGGVMLLIVVVILLLHKRRLNSHVRRRVDGDYFSCPEKLLPLKTYIDPHTYEDPCAAVLKFASEIHPSHITKQKVIGAGEFGEVYRGSLKIPGRCEVAVAIKTLKPGYTEKQRQDFLSEASIMGQFSHKNIIRLEGVVTKFKDAMIITELPAPMGCPSAVNQLMLQCWLQDRSKRPRFVDIVNLLEKLLRNPESLSAIASIDPRVSIRLPSTSGNDGAPFRSLDEWLESIKMAQYRETFALAGIKTMEQVLNLKIDDIANIGVRLPGHQKRIAYSILGLQDPTATLDVFAV